MSQSFIYDTELRLTEDGADNGTRKIPENTVLVVVRGMSLAKEFRIAITRRPMTFNQDVKALHCADHIDPQFLFYALKARKDHIRDLATEASHGTKKLESSTLNAVEILVPDTIEEQRAVAAVALNYDDLIENNRRRIALLEDAARQLYKEWFVRFRFPGHEHVALTDGVPQGWEKTSISRLCIVGRGASPRPIQAFIGGTVPWFKIGDATASESPFVFQTAEAIIEQGIQKSVFLGEGELILSNSATCGVPNFTAVSGCIHDGWLHFRGLQKISKYHLYCYLVEARERLLQGIGEGATQKNLNTDYVGRQTISFPTSGAILEQFETFAESTFLMIERLARQNLALRKARDLLLPKLMNGTLTA